MTTPALPFVSCHAVLLGMLALWPQAPDVAIRLVDVAGQAGITLLNICGGSSKDFSIRGTTALA